ncbi:toll/interleukin-1 receptor domain-containing protein [Deinococcus aquaedulcis]|uniref:toll/interleukin-1 receptor domain-containing protein n=1 Tax=Deinococcus aquaedulcis TaxID=2840455 RepID=UPI001C82D6B2|nr:toll/interleukin-1 receptor domain-containing protein [Deinococcus aquaedulcis]
MKIFISWSGEKSKEVARILWDWLPSVVQSADPWMSDAELKGGERWSAEIEQNLLQAQFGIICVTPENQNSSWLNFEAGAISNTIGRAKLAPLLFGLKISELSGPLSQFHAKTFGKEDIYSLLDSINISSERPLPESRLRAIFESLWPNLISAINDLPSMITRPSPKTTDNKIDEIMDYVKTIENRMLDSEIFYSYISEIKKDISRISFPETVSPIAEILRLSSLQLRAFLRVAQIDVDSTNSIVTFTYSAETEFQRRNLKSKELELHQTVARVLGKHYQVIIK